jgi:hypothetical protein
MQLHWQRKLASLKLGHWLTSGLFGTTDLKTFLLHSQSKEAERTKQKGDKEV